MNKKLPCECESKLTIEKIFNNNGSDSFKKKAFIDKDKYRMFISLFTLKKKY